ncbi:MAG: hypothetical protein ABI758_05885 [Candidatus Woesebacteria bacterium]
MFQYLREKVEQRSNSSKLQGEVEKVIDAIDDYEKNSFYENLFQAFIKELQKRTHVHSSDESWNFYVKHFDLVRIEYQFKETFKYLAGAVIFTSPSGETEVYLNPFLEDSSLFSAEYKMMTVIEEYMHSFQQKRDTALSHEQYQVLRAKWEIETKKIFLALKIKLKLSEEKKRFLRHRLKEDRKDLNIALKPDRIRQ